MELPVADLATNGGTDVTGLIRLAIATRKHSYSTTPLPQRPHYQPQTMRGNVGPGGERP